MKIYSAPTLRDQSRRRSIHITWLMFLCVHLSSWGQQAITLEKAKAKDREVVELQTLVVTGSNIKRLDMEKVLPVTVITKESMEARNAFTPVDLLTSLPQVTNVPLNETQTGSSGARGDNASINLRNIGSGSTLIAAQETNRTAYLMELDPHYVDVICARFQKHTGIEPVLEATGVAHNFSTE